MNNAKQLVGVTIGILLTASAVVAFFQHVPTTLNRRVHYLSTSSSQIASTNDDLSSLLGTTKYELETGMKIGKTVTKTAKAVSSKIADTAATTTSTPANVPSINDASEASKAVFKSLSPLDVTPPVDGKALPLGNFIKASLSGDLHGPATHGSSAWDTAVANAGILTDNIFKLIGKQPSELSSLKFHSNITPASIGQYIKNVPEEAKPWLAVVAGATLVIWSNNNKKTTSKETDVEKVEDPERIQVTSDALGSLTDELGTLQSRMKSLEANGLDLDSKLKNASSKLTEKELDISKERLKAADLSLNLGREIERLKQNLNENNRKVETLDVELTKARVECDLLLKELDKAKANDEKKVEDVPVTIKEVKNVKDAPTKSKPKKKEEELPVASIDEAKPSKKKNVPKGENLGKSAAKKKASPKRKATKVQTEELPIAEAPVKANTAVKKIASPKQKVIATKVQTEELPVAEAPAKESAPKKKTAAKKVVTKVETIATKASVEKDPKPEEIKVESDSSKVVYPKQSPEVGDLTTLSSVEKDAKPEEIKVESDSSKVVSPKQSPEVGDLTTLSKSALSRKTVKDLTEFLESKGLPTTGDDGKPLKKNGLLEKVHSI